MRSRLEASLWVFFFLSGATGLFYEIVWMRQLILVFGSTTYAVAAVLSAFMTGLAVGAFAFGRLADRGSNLVAFYGWLEIGVGLYALVAPFLLHGLAPLFVHVWGEDASPGPAATLSRFAGSLLILLPPTILMGGTLPVLSRLFSSPGGEHAGPVGRLYAINTFGAVAGTFLAGFVLLPVLGTKRATLLAAGVNLSLGLLALVLSRSRAFAALSSARGLSEGPSAALDAGTAEAPQEGPPVELSPPPSALSLRTMVLIVFALSGFAAMLYEVGWTRVLALTIGSSVYGFTLMLIAFLVGLAGGAALFARLASRMPDDPLRLLAFVFAGVGAASWSTSLLFRELPYLFARVFTWTRGANMEMHAAELGLCLLIMFPATLLMGGVFPLILRLYARSENEVGSRVGEAYAANTIGTVLGSAAAGFLLLPGLGIRNTLLLAVCIDLLLAAVVLSVTLRTPSSRAWAWIGGALVCGAMVLGSPSWDVLMMNSGMYLEAERLPKGFTRQQFRQFALGNDQILYFKEGMNASVVVGRDGSTGSTYLKVNGKADASTGIDLKTQVLLGHIPMLFHANPDSVLVIGLASGISVASVATHSVSRIRVLEIEPAMKGACEVFGDWNHRILSDPRVSLVFNDARNDILLRKEPYDVIVSEPSNPWMTVAANLFTREFFQAAKSRLRPGGIFCQWFQVYSLKPDDLRALLATFHTVFPHVLVFGISDASDLIVLGSDSPLRLDYAFLQARMSELMVAINLGRFGIRRPEDLLAYLYISSDKKLDDYVRGAAINTDDNALIEFSAPLSLRSDTISANQRDMLRHRSNLSGQLTGLPAAVADRRQVFLNLADDLLRAERPRAALDALAMAETMGQDDRSRKLRSSLEAKISRS